MRAGTLCLFTTDPDRDEPESSHGDNSSFQIEERTTLGDGPSVFAGDAVGRESNQTTLASIGPDGGIDVESEEQSADWHAEWCMVPGPVEEGFAVLGHGAPGGDDLAAKLMASVKGLLDYAEIDLNAFAREHTVAKRWCVGFDSMDRTKSAGTIYSMSDPETGDVYGDVADGPMGPATQGDRLTQLGVAYDRGGTAYKALLCRSGYVALYAPKVETEGFAAWVRSEVLPFAEVPDDDE